MTAQDIAALLKSLRAQKDGAHRQMGIRCADRARRFLTVNPEYAAEEYARARHHLHSGG